MKILLGGTPVQNAPPAAVTIGNFDGVHLGHRHILQHRSEGTRLNSSHLVISYAVFCLKKKKKK